MQFFIIALKIIRKLLLILSKNTKLSAVESEKGQTVFRSEERDKYKNRESDIQLNRQKDEHKYRESLQSLRFLWGRTGLTMGGGGI